MKLIIFTLFSGLCVLLSPLRVHADEPAHLHHHTNGLQNEKQLRAAASVASIASQSGHFQVKVSPEFLERKIEVTTADGLTEFPVATIINMLSGRFRVGGTQTEPLLEFPYFAGMDPFLASMMRAGLIEKNDIRWVPRQGVIPEHWRPSFPGESGCSSFRVSEDKFFTANHCMPDQYLCDLSRIRFNEELDFSSPDYPVILKLETYPCEKVLVSDHTLDFTVFQIRGIPDKEAHPIIPISLATLHVDQPIRFIGHPGALVPHRKYRTLKQHLGGKVVETGFEFKPPTLPLFQIVDMDGLWEASVVRARGDVRYAIPSIVSDGVCHPGMSGCAALSEDGKAVGILSAIGDYQNLKKVSERENNPPDPAQENKPAVLSHSFVISNQAIYEKHGAELEQMGVIFVDKE